MIFRHALACAIFMSACLPLWTEAATANAPNCPSGQHWVKQHHRRAYVRADEKHFGAATVKAHCSANPPGFEHWLTLLRNGKPQDWPHPFETGTNWTDEERERALEALSYLPNGLTSQKLEGIFRAQRSSAFSNPASNDDLGRIVLYDSAFDSDRNLAKILAHEFAHRIYAGLSTQDQENYNYAAGCP
jgi:hypothetical protein